MLPVDIRIGRTERWLERIEQDFPLLDLRVAALSEESRRAAKSFAQALAAETRAELERLTREKALAESEEMSPQASD
jgi:hypothetical protein